MAASLLLSPRKQKSLRKVELKTGVQRIIKQHQIISYEIHLVYKLLEDDSEIYYKLNNVVILFQWTSKTNN